MSEDTVPPFAWVSHIVRYRLECLECELGELRVDADLRSSDANFVLFWMSRPSCAPLKADLRTLEQLVSCCSQLATTMPSALPATPPV